MKSALQKFRIAIWALMSLVACDSKEPMTSDEAANWVANMKCSFVLIIVLGVLCGCVRPKKADSSGAESIDMPESKIPAPCMHDFIASGLSTAPSATASTPPLIPCKWRKMPSITGKLFFA